MVLDTALEINLTTLTNFEMNYLIHRVAVVNIRNIRHYNDNRACTDDQLS